MEYSILTPDAPDYPAKVRARMGHNAPVLYYHGPLKLLQRFCLGVICSDNHPGWCFLEGNQLLFTIRDYALNYVGGWQSIIEMEIFRLSMDTPLDPHGLRSTTMLTTRGLQHETWDNYLDDRWGPAGPFRDFPQKKEYYRRAQAGELLVISATEPGMKRVTRHNIILRNDVACALSDVVFVPYADKGSRTMASVKHALNMGVPLFTVNVEQNNYLLEMGIPTYTRKTVGKYLESLGASKEGEPPFPKPDDRIPTNEELDRRTQEILRKVREYRERKAAGLPVQEDFWKKLFPNGSG